MSYPQTVTGTRDQVTHDGAAFGVPASPRFPDIEKRVLAYWAEDDTFRASVERRDPGTGEPEPAERGIGVDDVDDLQGDGGN